MQDEKHEHENELQDQRDARRILDLDQQEQESLQKWKEKSVEYKAYKNKQRLYYRKVQRVQATKANQSEMARRTTNLGKNRNLLLKLQKL
jgi:hypothetical protein